MNVFLLIIKFPFLIFLSQNANFNIKNSTCWDFQTYSSIFHIPIQRLTFINSFHAQSRFLLTLQTFLLVLKSNLILRIPMVTSFLFREYLSFQRPNLWLFRACHSTKRLQIQRNSSILSIERKILISMID